MVLKILLFGCLIISSASIVSAVKELKLLHVLSANKFYVPGFNYSSPIFEVPKNLSYDYFLNNAADLPNSVKMDLFNLGVYLRSMYGNFIGSIYLDESMKMQTTGFPVSIMAGELINAGLWPPVEPQIWKEDLLWQPIPFDYIPVEEDALLLGTLCPNFEYETLKVLDDYYNLTLDHAEILTLIREEGQIDVTSPIDASLLHLALDNSMELNQAHPDWLSTIYPSESLTNITLTAYDLLSTTKLQKRLNGGSLLKAIIKDSKDHINGTLSQDRKINIYSGDDRNLAGVLKNLNMPLHDLPEAGAALIFELLTENNTYFIKINYYTGVSNETLPHQLDGCDLFCPLDKFVELVSDVLPGNELSLCGSMVNNANGTENSQPGAASSNINFSMLAILPIAIISVLDNFFLI